MDSQPGQPAGGPVPSTAFVERRHASTDHAVFVVVPWRRFFAIDGIGDSLSAEFEMAASELSATLHECERLVRLERFHGSSLRAVAETLWWPPSEVNARRVPRGFADRSNWHWRQLLEIPDAATEAQIADALAIGRGGLARQFAFAEGPVGQWLHTGGSDGETRSVRRLFDAIAEAGYRPSGPLHVLALADPRSVPQGRARAIFRQPIA
jgi:hypothetical protein